MTLFRPSTAALVAAVFLTAAPGFAAGAKPAAAVSAPAAGPRLDLTIACEAREGLSLCVGPAAKLKKAKPERAKAAQQAGTFDRLTQLAGMFMGRVDAVEIGDFRFRFKLDLR